MAVRGRQRFPASREKPEHIGVPRRRIETLRGSRRQQWRRQVGKIRRRLACLDGRQRPCEEGDANNDAGRSGKSGECWRAPTEDKGFARRSTPTMIPAEKIRIVTLCNSLLHKVHVADGRIWWFIAAFRNTFNAQAGIMSVVPACILSTAKIILIVAVRNR